MKVRLDKGLDTNLGTNRQKGLETRYGFGLFRVCKYGGKQISAFRASVCRARPASLSCLFVGFIVTQKSGLTWALDGNAFQ